MAEPTGFRRGAHHVSFARVRTARVVPTPEEVPVLEALMVLACVSEVELQRAAAVEGISKRWFSEGYSSEVGRFQLPGEVATMLRIEPEVAQARLASLVRRGLIAYDSGSVRLPEKLRRKAVTAWNARPETDALSKLPRVMYPRTRYGRPAA